ncbi:hypothetical protein [Bradyrhizobium manausense]|uniref:CsbD-like domain-containing protein n=1 Tax=Bradyrhizobium manausense TaxID=989370 RepID=A0A0R3D8R9_9BRAD|nr:hypothetical protein [Bradyrhizobium manausense]KRQ06400.1 hypothetical protein AOQ71_25570 [Bradyrhizobium manausense]
MSKAKDLRQRLVGKAKQAVGEIIGDQALHDNGKAEADRPNNHYEERPPLNPLKKLRQLT